MSHPRGQPTTRAWRGAVVGALALALAAVNLSVRLDREMIDVWDESLYATSALEMRASGQWAVTTFQGAVDYFNSKPPLNVWLIAGSFDLFGVGLVPLRLPAALAAWLTILTVCVWTWRVCGAVVAALATMILATSYAFLYVHAGRTANADAPLTLVVTLVFVTLWTARERPWRAVWLGPLAAAAVLLKGPAALAYLLPLVLADAIDRLRASGWERRWLVPRLAGGALAAVPLALWAVARWRFDGWAFLGLLVSYDIVNRATVGVEGHGEPLHYYVEVLLRHHYEWLTVTVVALALAPTVAVRAWHWLADGNDGRLRGLVAAWLVATLVVPTLVPTKLAWYLTPFYPGAAVLTALAVHHAWQALRVAGARRRAQALVALVAVAALAAEGRMIYRSVALLDLDRSAQGLLLAAGPLPGVRVFGVRCPYPEAFLAAAAGATCLIAADLDTFRRAARPGDLWLDGPEARLSGLEFLGRNRRASLHRQP